MLHDLGGKFHKITRNVGQSLVLHFGKQAMQGMAELMEEGLGLVQAEHDRFLARSRGEIADNGSVGNQTATRAVVGLFHIGGVPGPARLGPGTGGHIQVQDA